MYGNCKTFYLNWDIKINSLEKGNKDKDKNIKNIYNTLTHWGIAVILDPET